MGPDWLVVQGGGTVVRHQQAHTYQSCKGSLINGVTRQTVPLLFTYSWCSSGSSSIAQDALALVGVGLGPGSCLDIQDSARSSLAEGPRLGVGNQGREHLAWLTGQVDESEWLSVWDRDLGDDSPWV